MIRNAMRNNLPIVETRHPFVAVKPNFRLPTVPPVYDTTSTTGIILNGCRLTLISLSIQPTMCTGSFCDLACFSNGYNQPPATSCACFRGSNMGGHVIPSLTLSISCDGVAEDLIVEGFTSKRFVEDFLVQSDRPAVVLPIYYSRNTNFVAAKVRKCIKYVNRRGGWSVVGWTRQAVVEDAGANQHQNNNAGMNNQNNNNNIEAGTANFHVAKAVPTTPNAVNRDELNRKKIDLNRLATMVG